MHFRQESAVATIAALVGTYGSCAAGIAIQLPSAHVGDVAYTPSMVTCDGVAGDRPGVDPDGSGRPGTCRRWFTEGER